MSGNFMARVSLMVIGGLETFMCLINVCVDSTLLKLLKEFWMKDRNACDVWQSHHVMILAEKC